MKLIVFHKGTMTVILEKEYSLLLLERSDRQSFPIIMVVMNMDVVHIKKLLRWTDFPNSFTLHVAWHKINGR